MKIDIVRNNYDISSNLEKILDKKLAKLSKYFDDDVKAKLLLKSINTDKVSLEIKIFLDNARVIRAQSVGDTIYELIDIVIPKVEGQIRKLKSLKNKKIKESAVDELFEEVNTKFDAQYETVKRIKEIDLEPISVKDASDEMKLLDRTFYAFLNKDSNRVNILYHREDGQLGLIDLLY